VKARKTSLDEPLSRAQDAVGRTPPWAWRLAAMGAGMAAATLVNRVVRAGHSRVRGKSDRAGWLAALAGAAVAAAAASAGRRAAQGAVTEAWTRRFSRSPK
jgi:hypothetical protein